MNFVVKVVVDSVFCSLIDEDCYELLLVVGSAATFDV